MEFDYGRAGDDELVERAVASDDRALDTLIRRHYRTALRYALNLLGERAAAEDAVQEAFADLCRALPAYVPSDRFRGWLMRIVVNECRSATRSRRRLRDRLARWAEREPPPVVRQPSNEDLEPRVRRALSRLPQAQREALLLHFVEGYPLADIARMTGASISAVKMRVSRARRQLSGDLDGR